MSAPDVIELLERDLDELLEALGVDLFAGDHAVSAGDFGRYRKMAMAWLDARHEQIRDAVCPKRIRGKLTGDVAADSAVLVSAVSGLFINDHGAYVLAALILKYGVKQFCAKY